MYVNEFKLLKGNTFFLVFICLFHCLVLSSRPINFVLANDIELENNKEETIIDKNSSHSLREIFIY